MSYDYSTERKELFTENGQIHFLRVRDQVKQLLKHAGAFRFDAISVQGSSWTTIACIDRLVELKEIIELPRVTGEVWQQFKVYTSPETNGR
jgi:hypothetical protein